MSNIDFFISYTDPDKKWAEWIAWQLENEDYTCAIQAWDFKPGGDFIDQMRSAMGNTRQTIAVLSPSYLKSQFANAELNAALAQDPDGKLNKLLPVMVVSFEPPDMLRARVYIDLVGKNAEQARRELLQGVRASNATRAKPEEAIRFPAPPSFPVEKPESTPQGRSTASGFTVSTAFGADRLRILFLASAAGIPLNLEKELQLIRAQVVESEYADSIDIDCRFDVESEDFLPALNSVRPHVLHFSGSMQGDSILLQSQHSGVRSVSTSALVGLLRSVKDDLHLVVLNACYSLECATALADVMGCAIGIAGEITDEAAIEFATSFYSAIASGRSVKNAFDQAVAALRFNGKITDDTPQLVCGNGVEADELFLVQPDSLSTSNHE